MRTLEELAQGHLHRCPFCPIILSYTTNMMIDLTQLTEEQLNEIELQIQKHKKQQKVKGALKKLKGYKVTFYMRFDPERHKDNDMLTDDGELDPGIFADYLCDNLVTDLIRNFELYGRDEDVSYPIVEIATEEEIEHQF